MNEISNSLIQIRLNKKLRDEASSLFERLGMTLSEAVRTFLVQAVAEQGMPFRPHIPNKETVESFHELEKGGGKRYASPDELIKDLGI